MPIKTKEQKSPLYLRIARDLEEQIQRGAFRLGDPVPSVRALSRQRRVSVSTVLQAYFWLENQGRIEARPKSGFYVRTPLRELVPEPKVVVAKSNPAPISTAVLAAEVVSASGNRNNIPFGAACMGSDLMPNHKLSSIIRNIARMEPDHSTRYAVPNGLEILRREGTTFLSCYPRNPLIDACARIDIRTILCRQERVGVGIADGDRKSTRLNSSHRT